MTAGNTRINRRSVPVILMSIACAIIVVLFCVFSVLRCEQLRELRHEKERSDESYLMRYYLKALQDGEYYNNPAISWTEENDVIMLYKDGTTLSYNRNAVRDYRIQREAGKRADLRDRVYEATAVLMAAGSIGVCVMRVITVRKTTSGDDEKMHNTVFEENDEFTT